MEIAEIIRTLSTREREVLGHKIGTTGQYITSLVYKNVGKRNVALALELHRITNGKFNAIQSISDAYRNGIDWDFMRELLNEQVNPELSMSISDTDEEITVTN